MPRSPRSESIRWDRGVRWHLARFTVGAFVSAAALGLFLAIARPPIRHLYEVESCVALFGLTGVLALACIGARDGAPSGRVRFGALTAGPGFAILGWIFAVLALWDHVVISAWALLSGGGVTYGVMHTVNSVLTRTAGVAYSLAVTIAAIGVLGLVRVRGLALAVRRFAAVSIGLVALPVVFDAIDPAQNPWAETAELCGGILTVSTLAVLSVLWAINPSMRRRLHDPKAGEATAAFTCPSCSTAQEIVVGRPVRCASCDLGVQVHLESPRCQCGYDLRRLSAGSCPECGEAIPPRHLWALAINKPSRARDPEESVV